MAIGRIEDTLAPSPNLPQRQILDDSLLPPDREDYLDRLKKLCLLRNKEHDVLQKAEKAAALMDNVERRKMSMELFLSSANQHADENNNFMENDAARGSRCRKFSAPVLPSAHAGCISPTHSTPKSSCNLRRSRKLSVPAIINSTLASDTHRSRTNSMPSQPFYQAYSENSRLKERHGGTRELAPRNRKLAVAPIFYEGSRIGPCVTESTPNSSASSPLIAPRRKISAPAMLGATADKSLPTRKYSMADLRQTVNLSPIINRKPSVGSCSTSPFVSPLTSPTIEHKFPPGYAPCAEESRDVLATHQLLFDRMLVSPASVEDEPVTPHRRRSSLSSAMAGKRPVSWCLGGTNEIPAFSSLLHEDCVASKHPGHTEYDMKGAQELQRRPSAPAHVFHSSSGSEENDEDDGDALSASWHGVQFGKSQLLRTPNTCSAARRRRTSSLNKHLVLCKTLSQVKEQSENPASSSGSGNSTILNPSPVRAQEVSQAYTPMRRRSESLDRRLRLAHERLNTRRKTIEELDAHIRSAHHLIVKSRAQSLPGEQCGLYMKNERDQSVQRSISCHN